MNNSGLGFKYERKKDSGALDERIRELKVSLHKLFPSNIVTGISTKNKDLYKRLREVSYELEKSPIQLITDWGFIWKQHNEYDFDQTAAKKLINDFNVKQSHLARWTGVSRQVLNNRLASKHGSSGL